MKKRIRAKLILDMEEVIVLHRILDLYLSGDNKGSRKVTLQIQVQLDKIIEVINSRLEFTDKRIGKPVKYLM
mgnify:FL=1|tara:strand:- start:269 stop:484 length:216 start_codon:yes stop_codon:yes gene_type:complete